MMPGTFDLPDVGFDHRLRVLELNRRKPDVHGQMDGGLKPEVRLPVRVGDVYVNPRLLPREQEQAERARTIVGDTQTIVADTLRPGSTRRAKVSSANDLYKLRRNC
jgi:hypothetical protein